MKKEIQILHAINNIDDTYIEEALEKEEVVVLPLPIKKIVPILAFSMCLLLSFVFIFNKPKEENVTISSPYSDTMTLEEAKNTVGFTFEEIPKIENTTTEVYVVMNEIVEVQYYQENSKVLNLRKQKGLEDCSGIYETFSTSKEIEVSNNIITIKGNNNTYNLASWNDGTYSYSIYSENGISEELITIYIQQTR